MASLRQIRGRIKSIQSSKQIMRAMQLVSASKLKRTQDKMLQGRVVMEFLDGLLARVLAATAAQSEGTRTRKHAKNATLSHPLMSVHETGHDVLVVIASDTGLCGSYNANLIAMAEAYLRRDGLRKTPLIFIGKRGHRYFTKRGFSALESYLDLAGRPNPAKTEAIGQALMARFLSGEVKSVSVLYSKYVSATTSRPTIQQWLPIQLTGLAEQPAGIDRKGRRAGEAAASAQATMSAGSKAARRAAAPVEQYIFEPSAEVLFADLLPRWAMAKFQLILLEAFTSEHSARMVAMKNATDNAEELLGELTRLRNRIRQASITKELSEIVGTAEALK